MTSTLMVVGKAADQFLEVIEQLGDTARRGAGVVARGLSADRLFPCR
jgi:hypothetical protein